MQQRLSGFPLNVTCIRAGNLEVGLKRSNVFSIRSLADSKSKFQSYEDQGVFPLGFDAQLNIRPQLLSQGLRYTDSF